MTVGDRIEVKGMNSDNDEDFTGRRGCILDLHWHLALVEFDNGECEWFDKKVLWKI